MSLRTTLIGKIVSVCLITIAIYFIFSCNQDARNNDLKKENDNKAPLKKQATKLEANFKEILSKKNDSDALVVNISYDEYFKKPKKYKGFYLNEIIDSIIKARNIDTSNCIIAFECTDGYKPIINFSKLY